MLKALADECTKALFFPIGKHATYHPEILKTRCCGRPYRRHPYLVACASNSKKMTEQQAKDEIEKGFSAVKMALGTAPAPFFRFPAAAAQSGDVGLSRHRATSRCSPPTSTPSTSSRATPDQVIKTVMTKLDKHGKGIILMHDFQKHTGEALPTLLRRLKAGGYKVVQMKAKAPLETLPEYDALLVKDLKVPTVERASGRERGADGFAIDPCERVKVATTSAVMAGLKPGHDDYVGSRLLPVDAVAMQLADDAAFGPVVPMGASLFGLRR